YMTCGAEYSPDGKWIASVSVGEGVRVFDAKSGVRVIQFLEDEHSYSLSFSDDGRYLVTGGERLHVFDLTTQQQVLKAPGHPRDTNAIRFAPGGKQVATGGFDNTVRIWDVATGQQVRQMTGHAKGVAVLAYSPDGTRLVSGANEVCVWNPSTGEEVAVLDC